MPELLIVLIGLAAAGALVLAPLRRPAPVAEVDDEAEAIAVRHRAALEALRDVEADRRAGSLDEAGYAEQLAQAETEAARTRAALDQHRAPKARTASGGGARATAAAAVVAAVLVLGVAVPGTGLANQTVVNQGLADAEAAESAREERIDELLDALAEDAEDPETLSALADAYLAGSTQEDLVRAAVALRVLIELEPQRADAYERIMSAYLRAGDYENARAAHDAYAAVDSADPVELAFFDGLIALRGERDPDAAAAAFDRFLELAPDDPRAGMVRGLREEAQVGD